MYSNDILILGFSLFFSQSTKLLILDSEQSDKCDYINCTMIYDVLMIFIFAVNFFFYCIYNIRGIQD